MMTPTDPVEARRRRLQRILTLIDGLELSVREIAQLKTDFCQGKELRLADDEDLEVLELELNERCEAVVNEKGAVREALARQLRDLLEVMRARALDGRRPLAKIQREDPPAEKTGTA